MTATISYNETDFIHNIMNEYDGSNYIIDFIGYCTSLFYTFGHFKCRFYSKQNIQISKNLVIT